MIEELVFFTLTAHNGDLIDEKIVFKEALDSAAEALIADNKWRGMNFHLYVNQVSNSLSGILTKGPFIQEYDITRWQ